MIKLVATLCSAMLLISCSKESATTTQNAISAGAPVLEQAALDAVLNRYKDEQLIFVIAGEFDEPLVYTGGTSFLFDQSYSPAITFTFNQDGQSLSFEQQKVAVVMKRL